MRSITSAAPSLTAHSDSSLLLFDLGDPSAPAASSSSADGRRLHPPPPLPLPPLLSQYCLPPHEHRQDAESHPPLNRQWCVHPPSNPVFQDARVRLLLLSSLRLEAHPTISFRAPLLLQRVHMAVASIRIDALVRSASESRLRVQTTLSRPANLAMACAPTSARASRSRTMETQPPSIQNAAARILTAEKSLCFMCPSCLRTPPSSSSQPDAFVSHPIIPGNRCTRRDATDCISSFLTPRSHAPAPPRL